jgi:hypothetical protein
MSAVSEQPIVGTPEMAAGERAWVPCDTLSSREDLQLLSGHFFGFAGRGN